MNEGSQWSPESPTRALWRSYLVALIAETVALVLTVMALIRPAWLRSKVLPEPPTRYSYLGLVELCLYGDLCRPFPTQADCDSIDGGELDCAAWRTSTFAMWISLLFQAVVIFTLIFILAGSRLTVHAGYKVVGGLLGIAVAFQLATTLIVEALLETSQWFFHTHWRLGSSWGLATMSWVLGLFIILGLVLVGIMSPSNSYEEFDDDDDSLASVSDGGNEHDDFYYYNRQTRREYLRGSD